MGSILAITVFVLIPTIFMTGCATDAVRAPTDSVATLTEPHIGPNFGGDAGTLRNDESNAIVCRFGSASSDDTEQQKRCMTLQEREAQRDADSPSDLDIATP